MKAKYNIGDMIAWAMDARIWCATILDISDTQYDLQIFYENPEGALATWTFARKKYMDIDRIDGAYELKLCDAEMISFYQKKILQYKLTEIVEK